MSAPFHRRTRASEPGAGPVHLTVAADGRLLIPAEMRRAMHLDASGRVTARVVDGELHLITPRTALRRLRAIARRLAPDGDAVVDEFIAEKRREAELE
jgi:bifunctional DNA-binding transcriptional regulator/antitoxin component of YhaV-PrlF toxin-antitoxin module